MGSVQPSDPLRHASLSDGSSQMRAIGTSSSRRHGPFVKINCAAIPSGLIESELFGHEKGAFTGAHRRKPRQFEHAHKGTICLDEIGELPLALQAKLLHVLQDFRFSRVGGNGSIEVDSRVIAATNRNLEEAMARGEFREDPYYRVNVVEIRVPPLRERREEIPALASWFLEKFNAQYGRQKRLSPETMTHLQQHSWSGNVRELENIVRRLLGLECPAVEATASGLPGRHASSCSTGRISPYRATIERHRRTHSWRLALHGLPSTAPAIAPGSVAPSTPRSAFRSPPPLVAFQLPQYHSSEYRIYLL